jgi:uncharacterized protein YggE
MKRLIIILLILQAQLLLAQHSSNQMEFRKKAVRTPRYREETNQPYYRNDRFSGDTQLKNVNENNADSNNMTLKCSAMMNVKADSYLAIFNLTQMGNTGKEADDIITKRTQPFVESLKTLGITTSDVYADMIYLIPIYNYEVEKKLFSKTYNEVPKGFEMQKNLHIRFKDANLIDDIVTLAAANEIYDLVTVEYFVKNSQTAYDTLRNRAVKYLAANAKRFEKLGLKLDGEFRIVSEKSEVTYPDGQYTDYDAFVSQSLEAARDKTVTTIRKPKTVAYNKLSYESFDIVINPEFLEPVVQYTYELSVSYTLNKEKLEPKNHYFIVDNNGALKELQIK